MQQALECGPVRGVFRFYKDGIKLQNRNLAGSEAETHMGVKVYRDGCRVRPYGEKTDDWLGIQAKKAGAGGKFFVRPNMTAGSVYISASSNPDLRDSSDRESGMDGNQAYRAFQEFVAEHVRVLNTALEADTKSAAQRERREKLSKILDTLVTCLNGQDSEV